MKKVLAISFFVFVFILAGRYDKQINDESIRHNASLEAKADTVINLRKQYN